jgi:hypothetical protein
MAQQPPADDSPAVIANNPVWDQPPAGLDQERDRMYWRLGRFIYHHNPYFKIEELGAGYELKLYEAVVGGEFYNFNSTATWGAAHPNENIPKPGQDGSKTWYFHVDQRPDGLGPDKLEGLPKAIKAGLRNVVKEIELEYGTKVQEKDQAKFPHIVILYAGGNGT